MAGLIGLNGKEINPKQPDKPVGGFYVVAQCPTCKSPIFYHGGGEAVVRESTVDEQIVVVHPQLFLTCACFQQEDVGKMQFPIPAEHNILLERQAIVTMFEKLGAMVYAFEQVMDQSGSKNKKPVA